MMDKVRPFDLNDLPEEEEEQVIKDVGLNQQKDIQDPRSEIEKDIQDLISEIEKDIEQDQVLEKEEDDDEEDDEEEKDDDEDAYKDLELHPWVTSRVDPVSGETEHGIQIMDVVSSSDCKRYEFDICALCAKPWTLDKIHQMSSLPCGHMYGMSCLKRQIKHSSKCPRCQQDFSLESVRLLYATHLRIPAAHAEKASTTPRWYSFSKIDFTSFKHYERELRTIALNNRSDVLKQRADVLRRRNDAMKRRTEFLKRMADTEKRAHVLERQNDAMKLHTDTLNRMTDEEEWAEALEQQADAEKRAETLRRKACALGQWADEYLRKADAFGQQAKTLRQQAKSLRELVDSYLASRKFYIKSYKEFLGLNDNKLTE